jgi:hypothetical protein
MPTFKATSPEGVITEYDATLPEPEHLQAGWRLERVIISEPPVYTPESPEPEPDSRMYGGRRLLTKLEFIELLGDAAYQGILIMAKASIQIEAWVKKMELTTPDADGYSINLDDPRTQGGITAIGTALEMQGVVGADWIGEVLNG